MDGQPRTAALCMPARGLGLQFGQCASRLPPSTLSQDTPKPKPSADSRLKKMTGAPFAGRLAAPFPRQRPAGQAQQIDGARRELRSEMVPEETDSDIGLMSALETLAQISQRSKWGRIAVCQEMRRFQTYRSWSEKRTVRFYGGRARKHTYV